MTPLQDSDRTLSSDGNDIVEIIAEFAREFQATAAIEANAIEDWQVPLVYASEVSASNTADHFISTPLLAEYLTEGLSLHSRSTER